MRMRKRGFVLAIVRGLLPMAFALLAVACTFPGAERPIVRTYVLSPDSGTVSRPSASEKSAVLLVGIPQAKPGYDTARMVYLTRPHEVSYYATNQWADTPARMLHPVLVQALARAGTFEAVVQLPGVARGDYRLDIDNLALEQQFLEKPSRVHLSLRAQLIDLKNLSVVDTREFEVIENAPSEDAYGGVTAANSAMERLLGAISQWLAASMAEIRAGTRWRASPRS